MAKPVVRKKKSPAPEKSSGAENPFAALEDRSYRVHFRNGHSGVYDGRVMREGRAHFRPEQVVSIEAVPPPRSQ